jgi:hypothetical protein
MNHDALLVTDHSYDPSLNIIYVIGWIHGTIEIVEIVEGINLAGLNFFYILSKFFLFFYFFLFSYLYHFILFYFFFIFIDFFISFYFKSILFFLVIIE